MHPFVIVRYLSGAVILLLWASCWSSRSST